MPARGSRGQRGEGLPACPRGACARGGEFGGLQTRWDRLAVPARGTQPAGGAPPAPGSFHPFCGAEGAGWEPPGWGAGKGLLPSRSLRLPSKAAPGRACCQHSYSWPSSALRESAVISSVIKGLGACSTSLKKQENNNNNDLCSGMLPSGVSIAFNAFRLRKLFTPQP